MNLIHYGKEQVQFNVLYSARKTLGIEVYPDCNVGVKPTSIWGGNFAWRSVREIRIQ